MLAAVMIVFVIVLPSGEVTQRHEPRRNVEACWTEARKFVTGDPAQFGGIALGAGCLVSGRPS